MAIFEHGGESEVRFSLELLGDGNDDLQAAVDEMAHRLAASIILLGGADPDTDGLSARIAFVAARELERRQLAAAPKINHEKFLERLDRNLHAGRFEEDYPGQHPLSKARVS